jgi:transcriptional regulator with XRE-family HTH domain
LIYSQLTVIFPPMPAKPLTQSQLSDAQRLRQAFAQAQAIDPGLTQEKLAHLCGWKTQGTVNQYLNGRIPLNLSSLHKFADVMGVGPEVISPDLAAEARGISVRYAYTPGAPTITATHPDDEPRDDSVYIPESRIEFSAGNGRTAQYELVEEQEPATYRLSWFQKYGINPDHVRRFRVSGDSMEPMLFAKDTILVNLDETKIVDNKLYAIRYGDELRVKYLRRLIDGTLVLRSVNPAYDDEKISAELVDEHISIIGRVRDRSGTGGL